MYAYLFSEKRHSGAETRKTPFRPPFLIDYDRLIFSNPFRRLSKKTQVHPLAKNDHVHNRLTHSLEVASVGRTLGLGIGEYLLARDSALPYSPYDVAAIVQSACLAHDIGNPPFGHAGEEIIKDWFERHRDSPYLEGLSEEECADFLAFDGNAQSFRIVTQLENNPKNGGMRLTHSTLASMIKYPWESSDPRSKGKKFSFFQSEKAIAKEVLESFDLVENGKLLRYPFSYLMEVADDICYALLDIKDAIELGILKLEESKDVFTLLCADSYEEMEKSEVYENYSDFQKSSRLCAIAINRLTNEALESFIKQDFLMPCERSDLLSHFRNDELRDGLELAKRLGHERIFNQPRKIELELGAYHTIGILLDNLLHAAYALHKGKVSFKDSRALALMKEHAPQKNSSLYEKYQAVLDFIAGMTDNYATHLAGQLSGMGR